MVIKSRLALPWHVPEVEKLPFEHTGTKVTDTVPSAPAAFRITTLLGVCFWFLMCEMN